MFFAQFDLGIIPLIVGQSHGRVSSRGTFWRFAVFRHSATFEGIGGCWKLPNAAWDSLHSPLLPEAVEEALEKQTREKAR